MPEKDQDISREKICPDSIRRQFILSMLLFIFFIFFIVLEALYLGLIYYPDNKSILSQISENFANLLIILGSTILLSLFGILIRFMLESINQVIIFPFDSSDTNIDGNAIADILLTELRRIFIIYDKKFELSSSDRLPLSPLDAHNDMVLAEELGHLHEASTFMTGSFKGVGNLAIGSFTLPVSNILTAIYMIRPIGKSGCIIHGSIHRDETEIYITSHINKNREQDCFIRKIKARSGIHNIMRDLAFMISHKFSRISVDEMGKNENRRGKNEKTDPIQKEMKPVEHLKIEDLNESYPKDGISNEETNVIQEKIKCVEYRKLVDTDIYYLFNNIKYNKKLSSDKETNEIVDILKKIIQQKMSAKEAKKEIDAINLYARDLQHYFIDVRAECPASDKYFFGVDDLYEPKEFLATIENSNDFISNILKNKLNLNNPYNTFNDKIDIIKVLNEFIKDHGCKSISRNNNIELNEKISNETKEVAKKCASKGPNRRGECFHLKRLLLEDSYKKYLKRIITRSWEDLKYLTEAKDNYNQYVVTKDKQYLDKAKTCCKKVDTEKGFGILFSLSYNLGIAFYNEENYKNSVEMFSMASYLNPSANAYIGEGFALRYLSNFKEAIDSFKRAIYFDDGIASPWNLLGNIYLGLGAYAYDLYDKSIACLSEAIRRDESFPYPWLYLCINYSRKAALQRDDETRKSYIEIALLCIEKAIEYARLLGYKNIPTIATAKAACLLQRGLKDDVKIANNLLLYNYSLQKYPFNKACSLYLLNRKTEAQKLITEAIKEIKISRAQVLFDPDIYEDKSPISDEDRCDQPDLFRNKKVYRRFKEVEGLLENYPDEITIMDDVRDILSKESDYIRASFAAVSGKKKEAIGFLARIEHDPDRFENDPHFESIRNFAVEVTPPKPEMVIIGSKIEIVIEVFNTTNKTLKNVTVEAKMFGLSPYSSIKFSKELGSIDGRFKSEPTSFNPYVNGIEHNDLIIDVEVRGHIEGQGLITRKDKIKIELNPKQSMLAM